jgi:dolichol kinase
LIHNSESGQISFNQELVRKATHMGALVVPGVYYFLGVGRAEMLWVMIPIAVTMILLDISRLRDWFFWNRFGAFFIGKIIRGHEQHGDFTGASYILLAFCSTIALFDKPIAIAAMAFIIVGDSFAAIVGRKFGHHRFRGGKSYEGSLACLVGTLIVAALVPSISMQIGVLGAVIATITEAVPWSIDDNVTVPLLSGLTMTIAEKMTLFG